MAGKRRKHSEYFKRDAVALSYNSEKNMAEIARYLGIHRSVLAEIKQAVKGSVGRKRSL